MLISPRKELLRSAVPVPDVYHLSSVISTHSAKWIKEPADDERTELANKRSASFSWSKGCWWTAVSRRMGWCRARGSFLVKCYSAANLDALCWNPAVQPHSSSAGYPACTRTLLNICPSMNFLPFFRCATFCQHWWHKFMITNWGSHM